MNTLELILSIASDVRQASLQSAVLKLAQRLRELDINEQAAIDRMLWLSGITCVHSVIAPVAVIVEILNIECWMTHGSPLSDYYPIDTLITRVDSILAEHGYLNQSVTA